MSKKETRFEQDKKLLLWAIDNIDNKDRLVDAILELATRMMFEKTFPHIDREFQTNYDFLDSVTTHIAILEDKVEELEKKLDNKIGAVCRCAD